MSSPAFIVDGFTEKLVIGSLCPGRPVSRTDLNGKSVTLEAIANKIASLIRLFNNRHYPIIVIIDREQREEHCDDLCRILSSRLENLGLNNQDIRICFADRMFENWIVADWKVISDKHPKPNETDGLGGASVIKKALGSYNKTTDGVNLFLKCDLKTVYNNSSSFKKFVDLVSDIDCRYLKFETDIKEVSL